MVGIASGFNIFLTETPTLPMAVLNVIAYFYDTANQQPLSRAEMNLL